MKLCFYNQKWREFIKMNKNNFKNYVMDALAYFDNEECVKHERNNLVKTIHHIEDDKIIIITNNDLEYLIQINNITEIKNTLLYLHQVLSEIKN